MKRNKAEWLLILVALGCFGFDLFHFTHHLRHDASLLKLPGVKEKIIWKVILVALAFFILITSKQNLTALVITLCFLSIGILPAFAGPSREDCERAREYLTDSGVARDAKEGFFGNLKVTGPRATFPSEMDKVTWWGNFKPFEYWQSPEFQAVWINPEGSTVRQSSFRGGQCALGKTTLKMSELPNHELDAGVWRVIVTCGDTVIDNHPFTVIGPSITSVDSETKSKN